MESIKIIGLTGSLRKGSYNRGALRAAKELMPEGSELEILDLSAVPFFNQDMESGELPESVLELRRKFIAADAVLLATPEYNYSIPPVLKNALDWISRDASHPHVGKPAAIFSVSPGKLGGARVQYHLRQVALSLAMNVLNRPEVFVPLAVEKFDSDGNLTDEKTRQALAKLVTALVGFVKKQK